MFAMCFSWTGLPGLYNLSELGRRSSIRKAYWQGLGAAPLYRLWEACVCYKLRPGINIDPQSTPSSPASIGLTTPVTICPNRYITPPGGICK